MIPCCRNRDTCLQSDTEAVEGAIDPLCTEMKAMRTEIRDDMNAMEQRLTKYIDQQVVTTNQNVQAPIADMEHRMHENPSKQD